MERNRRLLALHIIGTIFIVSFGGVSHFLFEWSGYSRIAALFCPVNESVWEHLKLGFWPLVVFSAIEYPFIRRNTNNYILAKAIGVLALQMTIIAVFYSYTAFTGRPILAIDISSFVIGAVLCHIISYNIILRMKPVRHHARIGAAILLANAVLFIIFTFYPPHIGLFYDNHSKTYGIVEGYFSFLICVHRRNRRFYAD